MINSQEVIERSFYKALLDTAVSLNYSLDPEKYLPVSAENSKKFEADKSKLTKYIPIFGTGNNQSKGQKTTPRIVVNARGFYPGDIGLPKQLVEKQEGIGFVASEFPYEALDQYIDLHLVANNQDDLRLLHQIAFWSIPQRGYIKPYTSEEFLFSGNIFLEVVNFFDLPELDQGFIEKIYQFVVHDTLVPQKPDVTLDWVPITDIQALIQIYGQSGLTLNIN